MQQPKLKQFVAEAPKNSGVYIFRNAGQTPLYIGKAINIHSRLSSYSKNTDSRIQEMLRQAKTITFQITESDIEALILESQLIKKYKPKFNIVMRDDKNYGYVAFTNEEFPKIYITHQPTKVQNQNIETRNKFKIQNSKFESISDLGFRASDLSYIGPFTDVGALRTTLRLLRRLFPYCTCKQKHYVRCLNAHIGKCLGFCCLKKSADGLRTTDYRKNIRAVKEILSGKRQSLIKQLEKEMKISGKAGKLEEALELQKRIGRVRRVFENATIIGNWKINGNWKMVNDKSSAANSTKTLEQLQRVLKLKNRPHRLEGYDISNIQGQHATGSMVVFTDGQPDKNEYRKFNIKTVQSNDVAMLTEVLTRRFKHAEWPFPDLIIVDGGKAQLNAVQLTIYNLQLTGDKRPFVIALTKDEKHHGHHIIFRSNVTGQLSIVGLSSLPEQVKNLILHIDSEAHRFAISHYRKQHRKILVK